MKAYVKPLMPVLGEYVDHRAKSHKACVKCLVEHI